MAGHPRFLTTREVAELLKVSEASVRRWTSRHRLPCYRLGPGRERRFLLDEVLAFLRREERPAAVGEGGHYSFFFGNEEEQIRVLEPLLASQLGEGQPVAYIRDAAPGEGLPAWLKGLAGEESDLLTFYTPLQAYLQEGYFDPDRMFDFVNAAVEGALAKGFRTCLITGEMSWSLAEPPGAERMMEYEARLNTLTEKYPQATFICQYDLSRFGGVTVAEALLTHPLVLLGDQEYQGFYQAAQ